VTLEDILEEIVGDIADEHDLAVGEAVVAEEDGSIVIRGSTSIREVNRALAWNLPEEDAVTVAGLVIDIARRIPEQGEAFAVGGFAIEVLEREQTRLTKMRIRKAAGL
jgi:Mg2+/Co2+ transporter CorB